MTLNDLLSAIPDDTKVKIHLTLGLTREQSVFLGNAGNSELRNNIKYWTDQRVARIEPIHTSEFDYLDIITL